MKSIFILLLVSLIMINNSFIKAQKISSVNHPEWSKNLAIYEVNIRQYSEEGTFNAVEKDLPRIKEMGFGIIWLMPIHPIGEKNRKGTLGSYYSVKDYKDVNPEFGTKDDFRSLVNKTHELGMYLIIDWVANHTAWDNNLVLEHPEWFTKDEKGNFVPPVDDWHDVIDLNFDNKDLWDYMAGALKYWVEEFNIDGYRCDVAGMVPTEFWNFVRPQLDEIKPVFMLAEWDDPVLHEEAFSMSYAWNMYKIFNGIYSKEKNVTDIWNELKKENEIFPADAYLMRFTSNHDENTWNGTVFERLGESVATFAVIAGTLPGMLLVYNGQEAGLNKRLEFFEKDLIDWQPHPLNELYTKLINLKKENKALWNGINGGGIEKISSSNNIEIFAFVREKENNKILVITNLSGHSQSVELRSDKLKGRYSEIFSNEKAVFDNVENFNLEAWEYRVYQLLINN